ncbi:MAG: aminotransferase class V-fold PLP-dependent enzyme [Chlorobi bacterium]|nr:aminotransferase class V-fold PLP-dependent enzyme [Chlorobiota bacterium]
MIDLRSDTVTRPTPEMLDAMFSAKVGDDVFGDDPTVKELESKTATMFGMEAALFTPSGTMANQIGINVHVQPGDEVICDETSHIYNFEGGGIAFNSGASVRLIKGDRGRITSEQVLGCINPDNEHYARTKLVSIENTANKGGGSCYVIKEVNKISKLCKETQLGFHLDGARLFNALTETGDSPKEYGALFDSISICLSKGLGAPVGSVLMGDTAFIHKARRIRKKFGGGMRQAGYLAAAGIYALDHNIARLGQDHERAKEIGRVLKSCSFVEKLMPIETNIIIFRLNVKFTDKQFLQMLEEKGIAAVGFGPQTIRFVTHLDFTESMLEEVVGVLNKM